MTTVNSRDEVLKHLWELQSHFATYHNHKETAAWAGLVLSSFLQVNLVGTVAKTAVLSCGLRIALTVALIAIGSITGWYLCRQFRLRRRGGDISSACLAIAAELISQPTSNIDTNDYAPSRVEDVDLQSGNTIPRVVLRRVNALANVGQGERRKLEALAYALLLVSTAFSIAWTTLARGT